VWIRRANEGDLHRAFQRTVRQVAAHS
jgi:hypothetical protein